MLAARGFAPITKFGTMYLMNQNSLGGYHGPAGPDHVVGSVRIGGCWCQPSYYFSDGPKIVSSGGNTIQVWSLNGSTSEPLLPGPKATLPATIQDPGSFTTISTSGNNEGIIWTVNRPVAKSPPNLTLYAFTTNAVAGATGLTQLYAGVAGTWPNYASNNYSVPVVANGLVYVASFRQLSIFGIGGTP
jgi:hypothetical protein